MAEVTRTIAAEYHWPDFGPRRGSLYGLGVGLLGCGGLGLLILATAFTLFQPHRITARPAGQFAVRVLGIVLLAMTSVAVWTML